MAHTEAVEPQSASSDERVSIPADDEADSSDRARQFFSVSLDLFSMADHDGYFQRLNPAFASAFGYTESELLGQAFTTFVHNDDRAATRAELQKLMLGEPALGFENRFRRKDGTYRWLAWTAVPTPEGLVHAAARDVTERRIEEDQSEPRMGAPVAGPVYKDEFLVSVSHDLQQPLTLIKGQVQLLQRRLARGETVDQALLERSLAYVSAAGMRMRSMLQLLLESALEQAGQPQSLLLAPTDVVALTRQAVDEHQLAFDFHRFHFEAEAPSVLAMVDAARLQRTIENLLSNAVKFTPEGGDICVALSTTPGENRCAVITVRDSGLGIPAADLPHIFDRFYRGANVVGYVAGNGLGMAAARQMVELHGGSIAVASEEGVGSMFTVCLPLGL
jgi:PAS domain S-box-containing protein